jgi:hypothetical protein
MHGLLSFLCAALLLNEIDPPMKFKVVTSLRYAPDKSIIKQKQMAITKKL